MNDLISAETENEHETEGDFSGSKIAAEDLNTDKAEFGGSETSERTLRRSLAAYEIGKKLRQLGLK